MPRSTFLPIALVLSVGACATYDPPAAAPPPAPAPLPAPAALPAPVPALAPPLAPAPSSALAPPAIPASAVSHGAPSSLPRKGPCATLSADECGHWIMPPLDHWRDAMENYRSGIVLSRQLPLSPHAAPLASYLNGVHNRLHPWFADRLLVWLDNRPANDPMNEPRLVTTIELAIAPDGHLAQMGVVQSSGVAAFDASALESFSRAAPFGPTPTEIRSADGNVWVQWQLLRDEVYACTTMKARPFLMGP